MNRLLNIGTVVICLIFYGCDSKEKAYYDSGELQYEYNTEKGERNGESIKYYKTGEIMQKSQWIEGVKEGLSISYYRNGQIEIKSEFIDGRQEGLTYKYDSLGNLSGKTTYKKSVPEGLFETYFLDGSIKSEGTYSDSGRVSETYFYYENGSPRAYEVLKNGALFYLKEYTLRGTLGATYFPLEVDLGEELCVSLLHSIIPKDSVSVRIYLQDTERLLLNTDGQYFQSDGLKVCTDQYEINSDGIIEGFLCEYYQDIGYGCTPFKFDTKKKRLFPNKPIELGNP